jgi:hypothetical protein
MKVLIAPSVSDYVKVLHRGRGFPQRGNGLLGSIFQSVKRYALPILKSIASPLLHFFGDVSDDHVKKDVPVKEAFVQNIKKKLRGEGRRGVRKRLTTRHRHSLF